MRTTQRLRALAICAAVVLPSTLLLAGAAVGRGAAVAGWRVSRTFGPSSADDVIATGPRNGWLAGLRPDCSVFIRRWTGIGWLQVPVPRAMTSDGAVIVGASSSVDAWTFTFTRPAIASPYTVAWRWDGRSWREFRFPDGSSVVGAAVFGPADAWAFGELAWSAGRVEPYVAHYNGTRWRRVSTPLLPAAVSPISPDDIWVVGQAPARLSSSATSFEAARWDGSAWRVQRLPAAATPRGTSVYAPGILALGPRDIWIDFRLRKDRTQLPEYGAVVLHFNGAAWTQVRVRASSLTDILGMTPDGRGGIWFAANIRKLPGVVFYDDRHGKWSSHAVPARRGRYVGLDAVATVPGSATAWAAGFTGSASGGKADAVLYEDTG